MNYAFEVENNLPEYWDEQAKAELNSKQYFEQLKGTTTEPNQTTNDLDMNMIRDVHDNDISR